MIKQYDDCSLRIFEIDDIDKKIEMNKQGIADNTVNIKIDWSRD